MKIAIIGAGPAGTFTAINLAKQGFDVDVYEEHKEIGRPFACTGIVTRQIEEFVDVKKITVNKISNAQIIIGKSEVQLKLSKENLVIDRVALDKQLAEEAEKNGARIITSTRYLGNTGKTITLKNMKTNRVSTKTAEIIIGADGPASCVAKANSFYNNRRWWIGMQAQAEYPNNGAVEFYPNIGTYAWIVPEDNHTVRIGVCARKTAKPLLDNLLKQKGIKKIISRQAGLIPEYYPQVCTQKGNVYLVGDAATQVKATTGGGIVQSLIAAGSLAKSIKDGTNYEKAWRKEMGIDLRLHLTLRKIMDRFETKDWERLIHLFQQERLKELLETHDREYPSRFIAQIIMREPRLLWFGRFLLYL